MANTQKNPLIPLIKKILPATVTIMISRDYKDIQRDAIKNLPLLMLQKSNKIKIPKDEIDENGMVKTGSGSGFIAGEEGIVVSNRHVVGSQTSKYTVITNDGKEYEAKVIARDPITDIAVLKISGLNKFQVLKLGDSSKLELGEAVLASGNALGIFRNTVSSGIISGLSRSISAKIDAESPMQEIHGLIQTDAAINPGNSGGPLVNLKGEVIGINVAIISGAQNISFALPINTIKKDLDDIKKYGHIRRPFLGVHYLNVTQKIKNRFKLPVDYGAIITTDRPYTSSVVPESPAANAGLKEKDIILELNGQKISNEKTVNGILENCCVSDTLKIKFLRGGKEIETKTILTERK